MNTNHKIISLIALMTVLILSLCACSDNWEAPYASLDGTDGAVSVRFDANGGLFAGTSDVSIVDVFQLNQGISTSDGIGFYLLAPDDPVRGSGSFTVSRNGYFLAGWYTEKSMRTNGTGEPLDEFGVLCSVSGRQQGYTYQGLWNFSTDLLTVNKDGQYSSSEPALTLYAAWIPYVNYEFYTMDDPASPEHLQTVQTVYLEVPQWSEKTGKLDLNSFPERNGYTFDAAFLDPEMTRPLDTSINGQEQYVDYESGTLNVDSVKIYTTWKEGVWFKVSSAQQFLSNARLDGNYILTNDLDFENAVWPPVLVKGKFSGSILGNGHTISNLHVTQADNSQIYGGLFGSLEAGCVIEDITFQNVNFTIEAGSRMQGAAFGLLTGSLSENAQLNNVSVEGTLLISEKCYPSDYTIGLLCGIGDSHGVTYTIDCGVAEDETSKISLVVNDDDTVSVTFH